MMRETDSGLQAKILQIVFSVAFVLATLIAVRSMMFGSQMLAKMLFLCFFATSFIIALDDRYWLFSAFLFGFYDTLPIIRFTGAELGSIVLVTTFFVRQALHRDRW